MSFTIGKLFHIIHISDDLAELDTWYDEVFSPTRGIMDAGYSPIEKRDASLIVIGDAIIEPMAESDVEGSELMPVGRFYKRFGRHWHSLAWYIEDVGEAWDTMTKLGVRVVTDGGVALPTRPTDGSLFTHPRDTHTQLEFYPHVMPVDPRYKDDFDPLAWEKLPLGLTRMAYATVVVSDLGKAQELFTNVLGGDLIHESISDLTGTHNLYVSVGENTIVELARPTTDDSIAARDLETNGDMCHAVTWQVVDLDRAEKFLASKGITIIARDEHTLIADPDDTFGAPMRFTDVSIPGDPRG